MYVEATLSHATSRTILPTKSKQAEHVQFVSTLSKGSKSREKNSFNVVAVLATKSNVASILLLVWTGFYSTRVERSSFPPQSCRWKVEDDDRVRLTVPSNPIFLRNVLIRKFRKKIRFDGTVRRTRPSFSPFQSSTTEQRQLCG